MDTGFMKIASILNVRKTTIKRLARLIRTKSDYHITEYDAKFVAEELVRLDYCRIK